MKPIIPPIDRELLQMELTPQRKVCNANRGGNEVYVIDGNECPNVLLEIGRLREISFREGGGGSGNEVDLDEFDTMENPYKQIVVWDPLNKEIIGGYRFILGSDVKIKEDGQPHLATSHMFHFSDKFIREYLPHVLELGRSFVAPEYQSSRAGAKAIYVLDNLWDGIAAVMLQKPSNLFFFGKMTMYPSYHRGARDLILHFLDKHFGDKEHLLTPIKPVTPEANRDLMNLILKDEDYQADYKNLKDAVRKLGTSIPPLVNSYMNISPTMKVFGTAINDEFSDVEETAILVCFDDMFPNKKDRHMETVLRDITQHYRRRFPSLSLDFEGRLLDRWKIRRAGIFHRFMKKNKS